MSSKDKFASADLTIGQINALVKKIGGYGMVRACLRDGVEIQMVRRYFPSWSFLRLGTGLRTAGDFRAAMQNVGIEIAKYAPGFLDQPDFRVADKETEVDLVAVAGDDLGFKDEVTRKEIYDRALELGLDLCPAEVGPQLRLNYLNQPSPEGLLIAMEPLADARGNLYVYCVACEGSTLRFIPSRGEGDMLWTPSQRWVFLRRNPATAS